MPYKNREDKQACQRRWRAARREKVLDYLGGKCQNCGGTEDLEVDHIDPSTKDPSLKRKGEHDTRGFRYTRTWSWIVEELKKCQLLCLKCHQEKTHGSIDIGRSSALEKRGV